MPVGNMCNAKPHDRSALPAWPEYEDSVHGMRDASTVGLHLFMLDDNRRLLSMLFGEEYVLALEFSRLYKPLWWLDEIRAVQSEASQALLSVSRSPGEVLPAGAGTPGDGQRAPDGARGTPALESQGRQHDYVSAMAAIARIVDGPLF
jgi:hypothetical protein